MKNYILSLATVLCLLCTSGAYAQDLSAETLLDQAVSLSKNGDEAEAAKALAEGTTALENEAKSSGGDLKDKILSKVGNLKSLTPLASSGKLQTGVLAKAVSAVKMLLGANRISTLLGKGESGLLGKASSVTSSLGLIKAGTSILGSDSQNQLNGLISEATKSASGLDKKGTVGKLAAAASSKQLGSIVKLVGSVL
ncbi:hypothetical protein DYBT9275_02507 [Dyadobacter sp. CECT 9275]|uniref:DUF2780 domain-containing protein n=1 Tax=Dyadobacter helix TaxID=2822344 RepID=A0A916N5Z2_9BACT|nr:hypothetical protein [Dyadobacter sp. CECT 9275]CAG5000659.1 hypothetical protein DYBT9275_02507 [Dyadobacter sp. CECT 9275]